MIFWTLSQIGGRKTPMQDINTITQKYFMGNLRNFMTFVGCSVISSHLQNDAQLCSGLKPPHLVKALYDF